MALSGCLNMTPENPLAADSILDTTLSKDLLLNPTQISEQHKADLEDIYAQAIGDFIRHVKNDYNLTFDTLYFGKHEYGQPDDFPDIALPSSIETTHIQLISPEQGERIQKENDSSIYINLIGWCNDYNADFLFVTFSNGFSHQFDFHIKYKYDIHKNEFIIENTRFENFRYKTKQ
jgi:hypothetical protein